MIFNSSKQNSKLSAMLNTGLERYSCKIKDDKQYSTQSSDQTGCELESLSFSVIFIHHLSKYAEDDDTSDHYSCNCPGRQTAVAVAVGRTRHRGGRNRASGIATASVRTTATVVFSEVIIIATDWCRARTGVKVITTDVTSSCVAICRGGISTACLITQTRIARSGYACSPGSSCKRYAVYIQRTRDKLYF